MTWVVKNWVGEREGEREGEIPKTVEINNKIINNNVDPHCIMYL